MNEQVGIVVLPGGQMPKRQTEGAIGFDVHIRALVSDSEMDPENPGLRKTLFDFKSQPQDPKVASKGIPYANEADPVHHWGYRLDPMESVLAGIGFVTAMRFPMFYWVTPRSGLSSKYGISVTNAPGTVDPDYRGEAAVLVLNRNREPFTLRHGMRIAQIIFMPAIIPDFVEHDQILDLPATLRGAGGFGSTGV